MSVNTWDSDTRDPASILSRICVVLNMGLRAQEVTGNVAWSAHRNTGYRGAQLAHCSPLMRSQSTTKILLLDFALFTFISMIM